MANQPETPRREIPQPEKKQPATQQSITPRKLIHTRNIVCQGFLREDGLWDIEGHITDVKTYEWNNPFRGIIGAGAPIHEMVIRLTMDDALERSRLFTIEKDIERLAAEVEARLL